RGRHDGVVGPFLPCALGAFSRSVELKYVVSARGYRLLFWLGLLVLIIVALGLVQSILLPFAAGFVIAYILAPGVAWLERRGVPRSLGSLIIVILFLVAVAGILVVLVLLIQGQIVAYLPRQSLETVRGQARLVSDTLVGFIHGQAMVCLILAIYYGVALTAAGLTSGLALGLLIGVLAIIPILGVTTGFILAIGFAALQYGSWTAILVVVGIFAFGQLVEANVLTPKLVGDRIHLHPVWVIFALFAGGTLYGFVGILLAVPAAAVIGVLIRFALTRYRASSLYDSREPPIIEPPS